MQPRRTGKYGMISTFISAFVSRRPWSTVAVALIFGPGIGMLYLGKGRKGLAYLAVEIVAIAVPFIAAHFELFDLDASPDLMAVLVRIIGVPHCYFVSGELHGETPSAWFARWYNLVLVFLIAPLAAPLFIRSFLWEPFVMGASSMLPGLGNGDYLFASKYTYGYSSLSLPFGRPDFSGRIFFTPPERGDLVVFKLPRDNEIDYIKRLIGLPGDRIQIKEGHLYINGEVVAREHLGEYVIRNRRGDSKSMPLYLETLPNGRSHRIIEISDQMPLDNTDEFLVPESHYFAMGDNRDNSMDSRVLAGVGFVPEENLVGRVAPVFWNGEEEKLVFEFR